MSIKVVFDGQETVEQAKEFIDWYKGGGEQDASTWLEDVSDLEAAYVDVNKPYKYTEDSITCYLKLFYKERNNGMS